MTTLYVNDDNRVNVTIYYSNRCHYYVYNYFNEAISKYTHLEYFDTAICNYDISLYKHLSGNIYDILKIHYAMYNTNLSLLKRATIEIDDLIPKYKKMYYKIKFIDIPNGFIHSQRFMYMMADVIDSRGNKPLNVELTTDNTKLNILMKREQSRQYIVENITPKKL